MSELYGMDEAIGQLNSRNQYVKSYNQGVNDFNQNVMNQYTSQKDAETTTDDLTYGRDLVNNFMTAGGFKQSWDNRKYEINKAKNKATRMAMGEGDTPAEADGGAFGQDALKPQTGGKLDRLKSLMGDIDEDEGARSIFKPGPVEEGGTTAYADLTKPVMDTYGVKSPEPPTPAQQPAEETPLKSGTPQDADAPIKTQVEKEADGEGHGLVTHAINKISGGAVGLDTAEHVSKLGGAVVSAGMGGVNLVGDIENMAKNKGNPFKKGASWESDVNNVGQIAQGISDVVGVVPGLEWVAGLGNILGGVTNVIGLFGDHKKNQQHDANVEKLKTQVKAKMTAPSTQGQIANVGASNTLKQGLQATNITSY